MQSKKPLLGLCPIGKFVFSNEDAIRFKSRLQELLREWDVRFTDLEGVLEDGLVKEQAHVDAAVEHFHAAGIDALFMPHCNFGTEGAVGMIARKLDVPVLLWGPRDEAPLPDGSRLRDSLCGLFASSNVLHKMRIPFTYIENCRIDEPPLRKGVDTFLRAVNVASALRKGVRIGHIGQRIDFFWTTIINEGELLDRFRVEVLPLDMLDFVAASHDRAYRGRAGYEKELRELRKTTTLEDFPDLTPMVNVLAMRDQMLALVNDNGLEALAVQEFTSLVDAMGAYCCFAESLVGDTVTIAYESDIHGAISNILVQRASLGAEPAFLSEFVIRHPDNDNAGCVWHAGAPLSMADPDDTVRVGRHWILPSPLSGMTHFRLKQGAVTLARFDGDRGEYVLAYGDAHTCDGPHTQNNYVWVEVDDWPHWERTLMEGPFIHHMAMNYGHHTAALTEACRYIPGLTSIPLNQ
ncbi:MAG: fucose isomerase [Lentisphaeria bacterium]|nr:fucose isomerase [Lentisphaeria bacterium]